MKFSGKSYIEFPYWMVNDIAVVINIDIRELFEATHFLECAISFRSNGSKVYFSRVFALIRKSWLTLIVTCCSSLTFRFGILASFPMFTAARFPGSCSISFWRWRVPTGGDSSSKTSFLARALSPNSKLLFRSINGRFSLRLLATIINKTEPIQRTVVTLVISEDQQHTERCFFFDALCCFCVNFIEPVSTSLREISL